MPELSAAAMCELPAMALGVISVALFRACASFRTWWLPLFAGFSFGLALHLKLTAALVIPGAMAVMFVQRTYKDFAIVSAVAAATFALGLLCTPAWNWNEVIGAHWAAQAVAPNNPYFRIPLSDFTNNLGTIAAALAAVLFYASERNLREIAFPLVFLATVAAVHSVHRPWWEYYHVHFAIPLAMLGALGFSLLWSRSGLTSAVAEPSSKGAGYAVALASIVALWCCFDVRFTMNRLRIVEAAIESIHGNDLLGRMAAFSSQTHLAYASGPGEAYLFHAGLLTPPELVILSYKRKWATGFGDERILGVLQHYEPEQLLLSRENDLAKPGWREFTQANYVLTYVSSDWYLYIHKKLHPKALPTGEALVKHFQL